jgi:hypothetical protein
VLRITCFVLLLAGCGSAKEEARLFDDYLATHPQLSRDEIDRLKHREVQTGEPFDRARIAFSGCEFEHETGSGALEVWSVSLPIGTRPIYVGEGGQQRQVTETGQVLITVENQRIKQLNVVNPGNLAH